MAIFHNSHMNSAAALEATYRLRAEVIKALAHPTRLRIVDRLAEEETCVCDLQALVGGEASTVSKHLAVLKNAGIVADRKEGLRVFYSLRVPCVLRFIACIDDVLESRRDALQRACER